MTSVRKFIAEFNNCNCCIVDGLEVLKLNTNPWSITIGMTFRNCVTIVGRKNVIGKIQTFKNIQMLTWKWPA